MELDVNTTIGLLIEYGPKASDESLDEAGIGIPFPQQDVHLDEAVIKALSN